MRHILIFLLISCISIIASANLTRNVDVDDTGIQNEAAQETVMPVVSAFEYDQLVVETQRSSIPFNCTFSSGMISTAKDVGRLTEGINSLNSASKWTYEYKNRNFRLLWIQKATHSS